MKILITGDTGLVGANLKERLRDKHEVVGLSRRSGFDLLNKESTATFIEQWKPDVVYHCAANAAESIGQNSPIDMTERNLNIFLHVLVPSIKAKVRRFIYLSSVAVYGDCEVPYSEDDICKPKDVYGVNKLACEQVLKILAKVHNFNYTIYRPHNLYGPHQDMSNPYKNVVALFMRNLIEGKEIILYGEGKMKRAFSYIDDVISVLVEGLCETFNNQTVNIGSSIDIEIKTLLEKIEWIAGRTAKVKYLPARQQEIWLFLASHKKLNTLLPYHETSLEEGLQRTWDFVTLPKIVTIEKEI
jgi:UDP-glucose 4-epimerase